MDKSAIQPLPLALGGFFAMAAAVGVGRFIYTPILPPMVDDLLLSKGQAGLIASANYLGYLAGALAAASPRLPGSARAWLLWSLAVSAVTTGAMGFTDRLVDFLVLRFVGGAASAFVLVLASVLVLERLASARRSDLSIVHFAGVGAGIVVSALVAWGAASHGGGWEGMWFGGGLVALAAVIAVALLVPGADLGRAGEESVRKRSARPKIWPLVTAYGLFGFGYVITAIFFVAIVRASLGSGNLETYIWLVVGLAAIPSVAAWTNLARRYGVTTIFAIACLVEALAVVASVLWISVPGLFVAAVLFGGTFMGITALGLVAARTLWVDESRRALAIMSAAFAFGQIIGPVVAGYGFDLTGSFLLPSLAAAAALCLSAALAFKLEGG